MSRLKKCLVITAKPRPKKKELVLTEKITFEVFSDNEDEAKADLKKFKQWMKDTFTEWADTALQHFLYAHNLTQDYTDSKYLLEFHIDKILKDESVVIDERNSFDNTLVQVEEDANKKRNKMEEDLFTDNSPNPIDKDTPPKQVLNPQVMQQVKDKQKETK